MHTDARNSHERFCTPDIDLGQKQTELSIANYFFENDPNDTMQRRCFVHVIAINLSNPNPKSAVMGGGMVGFAVSRLFGL